MKLRSVGKYILFVTSLVFAFAASAAAQDHRDVVAQVVAESGAPDRTLEGALQFVLRVVTKLNQQYPSEHAGLLEKVAGESIIPYNGTLVSASRIAYPNQKLFKILTDVPTTNGPEWADDGFASVGGFLKGYLPMAAAIGAPPVVIPNPQSPIPNPQPAPIVLDLSSVQAQLAQIAKQIDTLTTADDDAHKSINQNVSDLRSDIGSWKKDLSAFLMKYVVPELGTFAAAWKLAK